MMAWRIAYCKVFIPWLTTRHSLVSARHPSVMNSCVRARINWNFILQNTRKRQVVGKEEGTLRDMRIVQEMYARGFEFYHWICISQMPDISRSSTVNYYRLSTSIDGMGDKAAESLAIAASGGKFLSKDDLRGAWQGK